MKLGYVAMVVMAAVVFFVAVESHAGCIEDRFDMEKLIGGSRKGMDKLAIEGHIDRAPDLDDERKVRIHALLDELYTMPDLETAIQVWGRRIQECREL